MEPPMSLPTLAFLDTSIFDGQQYNFSSTAFSTFAPACKSRGVKLILPDPTEREIQRHIREKSQQAVEALDAAIRKAPFLSKWRRFAQKAGPDWEVQKVARDEWTAFMNQFDVIRLGYKAFDITQVMNWYDQNAAPFGRGKKQKEFPDAIAIALLADYAHKQSAFVAVVSSDPDFESACKRFPSLLYFKSLQSLTELLIASDDSRVVTLQTAIQKDLAILEEAVYGEAENLSFVHSEGYFGLGESFKFRSLSVNEVSVVAIGSREATVTFEAGFVVEFEVNWEERGSDDDPEHYFSRVEEDVSVTGSAKIAFDDTAEKVTGISYVALDDSEIELRSTPSGYWYK
jgi:hypothetical protein